MNFDPTILIGIIGAFGSMLAGFYAIIKFVLSQSANDRSDDRKERQDLTAAIKMMAESTDKVAQATVKGNNEAKQRNGHLGEQNIQLATMLTAQTKKLTDIKEANNRVADILESSASKLDKNTKLTLAASEKVADALFIAADKVQSTPIHAEPQTIDITTSIKSK